MKKIVHPSYFVFDPGNNRIDFSTFPNFNFTFLYAVINVTAGKLIYSTAGEPAGFQGTYSAPYLNLNFDVSAMSGGDELQIIYNLPAQPIADADENGIFSTIDIDSGERGLNFNLLNSSFGGRINEPLSSPHEDKALAIGINSGGFLRSPAIDPVTNQLIVDISQSGTIPTSIVNNPQVLSYTYNPSTSSPASFGAGASDANTQRVTANINQISDAIFVGSAQTAVQNNIITGGSPSTPCADYRSFSAQLVCTATAGTFIFEASMDNVNFVAVPVYNSGLPSPVLITSAITASSSQIVYTGSIPYRFFRIRIATLLTGGTVTAYVRLSPVPFVPTVTAVANSTASNLNANVSGAVAVSGTVTSNVSAATLGTGSTTDIGLTAITGTVTSANIAIQAAQTIALHFNVTIVSGTSPTLDIQIEETFDNANYTPIYNLPRITSAGIYQTPLLRMSGIGYRVVRTVAGSSPSFTMNLTRVSRQVSSSINRLFINRTIDPNAIGSSTPAFYTDGCNTLNLCVSMNGGGSGTPTFKLQGSEDQILWFDLGATTVAVAPSSAGVATYSGYLSKFTRAQVTTAGSGTTLSQVCIKANGV